MKTHKNLDDYTQEIISKLNENCGSFNFIKDILVLLIINVEDNPELIKEAMDYINKKFMELSQDKDTSNQSELN